MLLTDLPDVLRAGGCDVVVLDNYRTHHHGELLSVDAILWHHTAGPATGDRPALPVVRYGRAGLPGPLAQLYLSRSGKFYVVSAGVSWQAGRGTASTAAKYGLPIKSANWHSIGIEMESTGVGKSDWTDAQIEAQGRGGAALGAAYDVDLAQQIAHAEWAPNRKIDPARWPGSFDGLRSNIAKYAGGKPGGSSSGAGRRRIEVDGKHGRDTTTSLQLDLTDKGYYDGRVDGEIDSQPVAWKDDNPGLTTGWHWSKNAKGSRTIRAWQTFLNDVLAGKLDEPLVVDGKAGPKTNTAEQLYLRERGTYDGALDGEFWKPSTSKSSLQKMLNSKGGLNR